MRKSQRRVLTRGVAAVVVAVAVAGGLLIHYRHKPVAASSFITSLQPGEFRSVPDACTVVSTATLSQYLPGTRQVTASSAGGPTQSQCSFTVDAKPLFRVLEVTTQAFQPQVLAAGNGGATFNSIYNYGQLQSALASPPKKSPLPKARISLLPGLGQAGLSALQVSRVGGLKMDVISVLVRDRNALIVITLQGQAGDGYGKVSVAQLRAGAVAVATQVLAKVAAGPVVGS